MLTVFIAIYSGAAIGVLISVIILRLWSGLPLWPLSIFVPCCFLWPATIYVNFKHASKYYAYRGAV